MTALTDRTLTLIALALVATPLPGQTPACPSEADALLGAVAFGRLGSAIAAAGDFDGDDVDDYVVGEDRLGAGLPGVAHVRSGGGSLIATLTAGEIGDAFGFRVTGLGDLTGDGRDEIAVGAYAATPFGFAGLAGAGSVHVYSGVASGPPPLLYRFDGLAAGDRFGVGLSGGGDLTGDGVPDVLVGADKAGPGGTVYAYSGATGQIALVLPSPLAGAEFGESVAVVGDVTGDGVADFVVGAPGADAAYLYAGGALLGTLIRFWSYPLTYFGGAVAGAGDVDRDGTPDVLVGARTGRFAKLFSGSGGAELFHLTATGALVLGAAVAGPGDVTGDGIPDLLVGDREHPVPGLNNPGGVHVFGGHDGSLVCTLEGSENGERFGHAIGGLGDLNGDGVQDIGVGANKATIVVSGAVVFDDGGRALVYEGVGGSPSWPATGDLILTTSVGTASPSAAPDVKVASASASPADTMNLFLRSPGGAVSPGSPLLLVVDPSCTPTGCPVPIPVPEIHVGPTFVIIVDPFAPTFPFPLPGLSAALSAAGNHYAFAVPPGLGGLSLMWQAVGFPPGLPAVFSNAHVFAITP